MTKCTQCHSETSQAILLVPNKDESLIFCIKCAAEKPLTYLPATEKKISSKDERINIHQQFRGLNEVDSNRIRELNHKLESLAREIFFDRYYSDIFGIPTFLEYCSLCNKRLGSDELYYIPEIRTNVAGNLDLRICSSCKTNKTIKLLLKKLEEIIILNKRKKPLKIQEDDHFSSEYTDITTRLSIALSSDPPNEEMIKEVKIALFEMSLNWNQSIIRNMKYWPERYPKLVENALEDNKLRELVLRALYIGEEISILAETGLKNRLQEIEPFSVEQEIPLLAIQLAELLWARNQRKIMIEKLKI